MDKSMEEINDALIALIILKVYAQSVKTLFRKNKQKTPKTNHLTNN